MLALPGIGGGTGKNRPYLLVWVLATGEYPNEYLHFLSSTQTSTPEQG